MTFFHKLTQPPTAVKLKKPWPARVRKLADSLLRTQQLADKTQGVRIKRTVERFNTRWNELSGRTETFAVIRGDQWRVESTADQLQPMVYWCDGKQIGVLGQALLLGRVRTATKADRMHPPISMSGYVLQSLEQAFSEFVPTISHEEDNRLLLTLRYASDSEKETRITIDTARHVVLRIEHVNQQKVTSTTMFSNFEEVHGSFWAGTIESRDEEQRLVSRIQQQLTELKETGTFVGDTDHVGSAFGTPNNEPVPDEYLLRMPLPTLLKAKKAAADGTANYEEFMTLVAHFAQTQQWDRVLEHLLDAEKAANNKRALRWVRYALLGLSRQREELRIALIDEATSLGN